jgi:hypothetical protein
MGGAKLTSVHVHFGFKYQTNKGVAMYKYVVIIFLTVLFSGCGPQEKYPEAYGLYAWNGTAWVEVGKEKSTIDLELPPETKFLIFDKSVAIVSNGFKVTPKIFIRNHITIDTLFTVTKKVESIRAWDVGMNDPVDGRFMPVKGQSEMVVWTPREKLAAGVYSPSFGSSRQATFTVLGQSFMSNIEQSTFCYDRTRTISSQAYQPCSDSDAQEKAQQAENATKELVVIVTGATVTGAANLDMTKMKTLISEGANVNAPCASGAMKGKLYDCAKSTGRGDLIQLLVENGVELSDDQVIRLAESSASIAGDSNGDSATINLNLLKAVVNRWNESKSIIKNHGGDLLIYGRMNPALVEYLLTLHVDPNTKNSVDGKTALDYLRQNYYKTANNDYARDQNERADKSIKLLLDHGAK